MTNKKWNARLLDAVEVTKKVAKKQEYEATHTADGVKIKEGMKVYILDDPASPWFIDEIDKKIYRRRVVLRGINKIPIKRRVINLFSNQKKAIDASIKSIKDKEKIILRNMKEELQRLNAKDRIKELKKLKKKV